MTTLAPTANLAKITIPTGYEQQQLASASKRKLAEAMLSQGIAPDDHMVSWAQVLGHLAQTWAGKSMQHDADKMDGDIRSTILKDYQTKRSAFLQDSQTMAPKDLVAKYGNEPLLQEDLKPYAEAFGSNLKNAGEYTNFGGQRMTNAQAAGAGYDNDPNKPVQVGPDGQLTINAPYALAQGVANGKVDPRPLTQSFPAIPATDKLIGAMMPPQQAAPAASPAPMSDTQGGGVLANAAGAHTIAGSDAARVLQSLGPNGGAAFQKWLQDTGVKIHVSTPDEAKLLPSGTPITLPDGTEGRVP